MFDQEIGAVKTLRRIIDKQRGSECGFEALENVIQLCHGSDNNVSERELKPEAIWAGYGLLRGGDLLLDVQGYRPLLAAHGIRSKWVKYDRRTSILALRQNRVAIAVVNPYYLDPTSYPLVGDLHAIVLTNFATDSLRRFMAYVGMDSNSGGKELRWSINAVEQAISAGIGQVLITDAPIHRSEWGNYEVLVPRVGGWLVLQSLTR